MPDYILPSGEANFFDTTQLQANNAGSGINSVYPSPSTFNEASGIYKTYPAGSDLYNTSGIFNYNYNSSNFSNALDSLVSGITNFNEFNPYVHYIPKGNVTTASYEAVFIPYVSSAVIIT
jgi:hypothetical protein